MSGFPRITFGIIILNGEPFTRYCLRSLYPFAHEIIVVEGASEQAAAIATPDGHSIDGTLDILHNFKVKEDPDNKLTIITAEDEGHSNGFWPGEKDEQSQAYTERATGDYVWQVDIDEFYKAEDMRTVLEMLKNTPGITTVSFKQISFWGSFDYFVDGWYLRRGWCKRGIHRIFKWGPGYTYVAHRPPTVNNSEGEDLRNIKWINGDELIKRNISLYHYSLVFPKQVFDKCKYYDHAEWAWCDKARDWYQETFLKLRKPYRLHNVYKYPSWLQHFCGKHPLQIEKLRQDIREGRMNIELRPTDDILRLLNSPLYRLGSVCLKLLEPWERRYKELVNHKKRLFLRLLKDPVAGVHFIKKKLALFLNKSK